MLWCNGDSRERYGYQPYQVEISFEFDNKNGKVTKIGKKGKYNNLGYILSGGFVQGKRSHYVVPEMNTESGAIEILQDDKETYIDDLLLTKKADIGEGGVVKVKKEFEFFALPEGNEKKPVFYIKTDRLHFGFTPYLRMFYSKSILDGIPERYKDIEGISYTDGIFGFINKPYKKNGEIKNYSYKSRVSFEDAEVIGEAKVDSESTMQILLAEPKPTSYNLYLEQDKNANKKNLDIYEKNFTIRGFKQYWLKDYVENLGLEDSKAQNMKFKIHPLKEGTKFKGKIYFDNLDEEELGLLIWALKLDENCYQNIGLAKPYGFGRVKVKDIILNIEDLDKKYNSFNFDYYEKADLDKYINIYKDNFSKKNLNSRKIDEQKPVEELMLIKSKVVKFEDANYYRYMEIELVQAKGRKVNEFRYMNVLPEILEYEKLTKDFRGKNSSKQKKGNNRSRKNKNNRSNWQTHNNLMAQAFNKAKKEKQKRKKK
ncbi:TIGR03986 family type III CRISPR-associated RAMP protein [Schnuerera sp.]|uniref:TIGR03986 family type III CRISPR-associated RAMP protein n=1 Tax=Schnuerera sp. TaxID=2794844 RepID=UPI002C33D09E|nr:TIGR03986 family CRISPR-associated RAMP protein [Schnuerera sp.]HSH34822.1 TIGR03986 family CRISPR-associated RAMP protein [Schnuerera sp.]